MPREEARQRLEALGEYFRNKHGIAVTWSGDSAQVKGKYLVVTVDGGLRLEGERVVFEGKDPGILWRGKAKDYIEGKLDKYLDPTISVDQLPRH
jgi:putative polyhydroxyalkanoic acid system protein